MGCVSQEYGGWWGCRLWIVAIFNFCHKRDVASARDSSVQEDQNKKVSLVFLEFIFTPVKENLLQNSIIFLGVNAWDQKDFMLPSLIGGKIVESGKQHRPLL